MVFITQQDLNTYIDPVTLNDIIQGDQTILDRIEQQAVEDMKAYINVRFDTAQLFDPNQPDKLPDAIKMYLIDLVLYHLHTRISPDHIPQLRTERYQEAVKWLEKIAGGFINPDWPAKADATGKPLRFGSGKKQSFYY